MSVTLITKQVQASGTYKNLGGQVESFSPFVSQIDKLLPSFVLPLQKQYQKLPGNGIAESVKSWTSKFDIGLLNAYNPLYFDRNISENKDCKKEKGSYLSGVTNGELYFSKQTILLVVKSY